MARGAGGDPPGGPPERWGGTVTHRRRYGVPWRGQVWRGVLVRCGATAAAHDTDLPVAAPPRTLPHRHTMPRFETHPSAHKNHLLGSL